MGVNGKTYVWHENAANMAPMDNAIVPEKRVSIKDIITGNETPINKDINLQKKQHKPIVEESDKQPYVYKPYFEKLKDPRWQKRRLEIMQRDGFSCVSCGSSTGTLNVHHCVPYRKNCNPWDYGNRELITLCEECHEVISTNIANSQEIIMGMSKDKNSSIEMFWLLFEIEGIQSESIKSITEIIALIKKFKNE